MQYKLCWVILSALHLDIISTPLQRILAETVRRIDSLVDERQSKQVSTTLFGMLKQEPGIHSQSFGGNLK